MEHPCDAPAGGLEPGMRADLIHAMRTTFGADQRRIRHARQVLAFAEAILREEPADALTVVAAAVLHDIGIQEAERVHASNAPRFQEQEGPPIARAILTRLAVPDVTLTHVCRIVGSHHSANNIDTPEFRIVWDADWLVNIPDEHAQLTTEERQALIKKVFRTATGKRLALAGCVRIATDDDADTRKTTGAKHGG